MIEHLNQIAIHAFYAGEHDAGSRACEKLLSLSDLPPDLERQARSNRTWYTRTLGDLVPAATFRRIEIDPARPGWSLFNPTLLATGIGLYGIVRSSNYRIEGGRYVIPEEDGDRIRTENILVRIGDDLAVTEPRVISGPDYPANDYPVEGLEDCRLRLTETGVGVSACVRNANGWDGRCRQVISDLDLEQARFSGLRVLESGDLAVHEKNWMPIGGFQQWIYASWHNGHTVTVEQDGSLPGAYQILQRAPAPPIARGFRGGSQLVEVGGRWLAVVHEVADGESGRIYEHRFVEFDSSLRITRVSPAFAFRELRAIEFAAGLARVGDRLIVSFGVRDAEAWLCSLTVEDACRLLAPVS